eukprot:4417573-Ditylum_brightwellii.AAC.1
MATSEEPDVIVYFTNVASCTNANGGKYKHGSLYSTNKRVEVAEIYMKLKLRLGKPLPTGLYERLMAL